MRSTKASSRRPAPFLVYQESDAVTRALRDYLGDDIGEIQVDDPAAFQKAQEYMQRFMPPEAQRRLKLYQEDVPLFTRFQIENQIESAYSHKVQLPSGGSLVLDYTEALVSIDINSARATRGTDIETTAFNTNLEAADEIARQLRIRDAGGLIVIDFIDMESSKNQREVEERLRDAVKQDRARIQIGRLSRFGLLEMSRQRLRPSLGDSSHVACPRCQGLGTIRSVESMALAILRLAGEDARKERTGRLIVQVPINVATYLMNEKRKALHDIEDKCGIDVVLVPNKDMETPEFSIRRVRNDELGLAENAQSSYKIPTPAEVPDVALQAKRPAAPQAAVTTIIPTAPAPAAPVAPEAPPAPPVHPAAAPRRGLFGWLKSALFGDAAKPARKEPDTERKSARGERKGRDQGRSGGRDRDRNARRGRDARPQRPDRERDRNRGRDQERRPGRQDTTAARSEQSGGEARPRREQQPAAQVDKAAGANAPAPASGAEPAAARPDAEKRSRRGGRRRRGRGGGRSGEGMATGGAATNAGSGPHSDTGGNANEATRPTQAPEAPRPAAASDAGSNAAPSPAPTVPDVQSPAPPPPPPPPPERPAVVWSSSAGSGSLGGTDRSQRDE